MENSTEFSRYVSQSERGHGSATEAESLADKLRREASLLGYGVLGVKDAAVESVSKGHRAGTVAKLAGSTAMALGLAYLDRGMGFGKIAKEAVGLAATAGFATDAISHGADVAHTLSNAWHSDATFDADKQAMHKDVGQFVFDTALMSGGALAGAGIGARAFSPRIPADFMSQFNYKTGVTMDYYNAFNANEIKLGMLTGDHSFMPPSKLAEFRSQLPERVGKTETYSEYWNRQISTFEQTHGTKLDGVGIRNALVRSQPNAARLDALAAEIRTFGDKDFSNPDLLHELGGKFQQARTIIYGKDNIKQTRSIVG